MKVQYLGLAPIMNIYGHWEYGTIKEIPDGAYLAKHEGFKEIIPITTIARIAKKPRKKKVLKEKLDDKLERDSLIEEIK